VKEGWGGCGVERESGEIKRRRKKNKKKRQKKKKRELILNDFLLHF